METRINIPKVTETHDLDALDTLKSPAALESAQGLKPVAPVSRPVVQPVETVEIDTPRVIEVVQDQPDLATVTPRFTGLDAMIADRLRPAAPAEPTEPTEPTEPGQPTDPTKPTEPTEEVPVDVVTPPPSSGPALGVSWAFVDSVAAKVDVKDDGSITKIGNIVRSASASFINLMTASMNRLAGLFNQLRQQQPEPATTEPAKQDQLDEVTKKSTQVSTIATTDGDGRVEVTSQTTVVDGQVQSTATSRRQG